jgi:hypothetical protein
MAGLVKEGAGCRAVGRFLLDSIRAVSQRGGAGADRGHTVVDAAWWRQKRSTPLLLRVIRRSHQPVAARAGPVRRVDGRNVQELANFVQDTGRESRGQSVPNPNPL